MLSVVIAANESERALVPTLAALVPGATAGLIREVIVADTGSRDATAEVADVAGCRLLVSDAPLGTRLAQAAEAARGPWLMFLSAGDVPEPGWVAEATRLIDEAALAGRGEALAAVLRPLAHVAEPQRPLREILVLLGQMVGRLPPSRGLLIAKALYRDIGGHRPDAEEPDAELLRRVGRRRIVRLRSGAAAA